MFGMYAAIIVLFSSFNTTEITNNKPSEGLETVQERKMLNTIEYVEECEEVDLGFDPYFYLPTNFNAYDGMDLELEDIEYIELEEELF